MTEHSLPAGGDGAPDHRARWRERTGAIARAIIAVTAGATTGWTTRDVGLGLTTAAVTVSILREAFARPTR